MRSKYESKQRNERSKQRMKERKDEMKKCISCILSRGPPFCFIVSGFIVIFCCLHEDRVFTWGK